MNMKSIEQHLFKIVYRKPKWALGDPLGTINVYAIDRESARKHYYAIRGKQIPHDIALMSIEQVTDN